jgi:HEAT repeat protein
MKNDLYSRLAEAAEYGELLNPADLSQGLNSSDPYVVWMAVKAAGVHRAEQATDELFQLGPRSAWPPDADIPSIAVWSLTQIGGEEVLRVARDLTSSEQEGDRRFAADLLGELRDSGNIRYLERLLEDPSKEVALWAALSLSKFGSDGLLPLQRVASRTPSPERTIIIADALCKIGTPFAMELAKRLLEENKHIPQERVVSLFEVLRTRAAG